MSHTSTPWTDHDGTTADRTPEWHEIHASGGRVIATLEQDAYNDKWGEWTPEEVRANAEFIVRACNAHDELLVACKEMETYIEGWLDASQLGAAWHHVKARLQAAIAKAEPQA